MLTVTPHIKPRKRMEGRQGLLGVNTFLTKRIQLSYLPWIKYFGLPVSVTWPVYRNVKDEDSSLGIGLKGMYTSSVSLE